MYGENTKTIAIPIYRVLPYPVIMEGTQSACTCKLGLNIVDSMGHSHMYHNTTRAVLVHVVHWTVLLRNALGRTMDMIANVDMYIKVL